MSRQRIIQAVKPRSILGAAVKYPWMYFPMHGDIHGDDTATAMRDRANAYTNGQSTELVPGGLATVAGTTSAIWSSNDGWFTPSGDNYVQITGAAIHQFCQFSTLGSGGLLICFRFKLGAIPTNSEFLFSFSPLHPTTGGFEVFFNTVPQMFLAVRSTNNVNANVCRDQATISTGVEYAYCIYADVKNKTGILYRNGVEGTSGVNPMPEPVPTLNEVNGCVIAGRSGATASNKLNQNASGAIIRDLLVVRCTEDISAEVGKIAQRYYQEFGEIPMELTNV